MAITTSTTWTNPYTIANRDNFYNSYNGSSTGTSSTGSLYGSNTSSLSSAAQKFLVNSKSSASSLLNTLTSLKSGSAFSQKTAVSSDTASLSIKSVNSSKVADIKDTSIQIDQIALAQQNSGTEMVASGKSFAGNSGYKTFEIDTGTGNSTLVSIQVNAGDSNEAVQKKMAEAINGKNLGITAKVSVSDGKSTLSVTSNTTGIKNEGKENFAIRDLSAGGGIAAWAGIDKVTQQAQNAAYRIDGGKQQISKTNDIDLGNGVTATLKAATGSNDVKVSLGNDAKAGINAVRDMVNGFNELFEAISDNKDDKRTSFLYSQMKSLTKTYEARLKDIGITTNSEGYLKIDEDAMNKAAEDGKLEKFFKNDGLNYGFSTQLEKISKNVEKDPSQYVSQQKSTNANNSLNYLQDFRYNQVINQGLLFESMI